MEDDHRRHNIKTIVSRIMDHLDDSDPNLSDNNLVAQGNNKLSQACSTEETPADEVAAIEIYSQIDIEPQGRKNGPMPDKSSSEARAVSSSETGARGGLIEGTLGEDANPYIYATCF